MGSRVLGQALLKRFESCQQAMLLIYSIGLLLSIIGILVSLNTCSFVFCCIQDDADATAGGELPLMDPRTDLKVCRCGSRGISCE